MADSSQSVQLLKLKELDDKSVQLQKDVSECMKSLLTLYRSLNYSFYIRATTSKLLHVWSKD